MQQILNAIRDSYIAYSGLGVSLALVWASILYLYVQENSIQKRNLIYTALIMIVLLLNPFSAGNGDYHRMVAIVPSTVLLAYAMAKAVAKEKEKTNCAILVCGFVVVLFWGLNFNFTRENIGVMENAYKVSDEAQELHEIVSELGNVYVIVPLDVGEQLREYDTSFRVMGGDFEKRMAIYDMSLDWSDSEKIERYAVTYDSKCIICPKGEDGNQMLDPESFSMVGETENYRVYVLI